MCSSNRFSHLNLLAQSPRENLLTLSLTPLRESAAPTPDAEDARRQRRRGAHSSAEKTAAAALLLLLLALALALAVEIINLFLGVAAAVAAAVLGPLDLGVEILLLLSRQ